MHVSVGGRCNNVIEACKNKEYVELAGYNGSILDELKGRAFQGRLWYLRLALRIEGDGDGG